MTDADDGPAATDGGTRETGVRLSGRREWGRVVVVLLTAAALVVAAAAVPAVLGAGSPPALSLAPFQSGASAASGASGASGAADAAGSLSGSQFGALSATDTTSVGGQTAPGAPGDSPLRNQSTEVHMIVESTQPGYWRTGAYGRYTGQGFERAGDARPFDGRVESGPLRGERVRYRVELRQSATALATVWRPARVDTPVETQLRPGVSLSTTERLSPGTTYEGVSYAPAREPAVLRAAGRNYPAEVRERYLNLPDEPGTDRLDRFTTNLTADSGTAYDTAVAIEQWLEANKEYSLDATHDPAAGTVASQFVFEMATGYCEYFATAMVAMLRTQGVPARYVVGYSTGQQTGPNEYTVRAMNAHAWVEVYFPEVGWVRFDPTPGSSRLAAERRSFQNETGSASDYSPTETGSPGESFSPNASRQDADGRAEVPSATPPDGGTNGSLPNGSDGVTPNGTTGGLTGTPSGTAGTADGTPGGPRTAEGGTATGTPGLPDGSTATPGGNPEGSTPDGSTPDGETPGDSTPGDGSGGDETPTDEGTPTDDSDGDSTPTDGSGGESTPTDDGTPTDGGTGEGDDEDGSGDGTDGEGESGDEGDGSDGDGTADAPPPLSVSLNRTAVPGATVTVTVTRGDTPESGVEVRFEDELVGTTGENGTVVGTVPYVSSLNVTVTDTDGPSATNQSTLADGGVASDPDVQFSFEVSTPDVQFSFEVSSPDGQTTRETASLDDQTAADTADTAAVDRQNAARAATLDPDGSDTNTTTYPVETRATLSVVGDARSGQTVTVVATVADVPVREATVEVDGEPVGRTDRRGRVRLRLPAEPGNHTVTVRRGAVVGNRTVEIDRLAVETRVDWPLALPFAPVTVSTTLGNESVDGANVTLNGRAVAPTGVDGTTTARLPIADTASVRATQFGQAATTSVSGIFASLAGVGVVVSALVVGGVVLARRRDVSGRDAVGFLRRVVGGAVRAVVSALIAVVDAVGRVVDAVRGVLADLWAGRLALIALPGRVATLLRGAAETVRAGIVSTLVGLRVWVVGLFADDPDGATAVGSGGVGEADGDREEPRAAQVIRAAWRQFLGVVSLRRTRTATPGEVARWAVERDGLPAEPVRRLRDAYRAVQYGDADPNTHVESVSELVAALTGRDGDGSTDESTTGGDGR
ncbi:transglutaminase domain-containing protein [Halobaculum sp. MBLA0147]|uniref:transglutaminase domain-containing protein n=1 Tax=Halobaculum sp. MBLA0147 TaxID=3079934 RepID=UPI003524AD5B